MSSSGSYAASSVTVSGVQHSYFFVNWQIASQNVGGNYTTINWQAYEHYDNCDAQLDNGYVNTNVGQVWANGGRVYNYAGNFTPRDMGISSGSFTVGADANGNSQLQFGLQMVVFGSGTSSGTSGVWNLDRIALAPSFSALTADTITPTSARLGVEITGYGHGTSANFNMYYRKQGDSTWIDLGNQGDVGGFNYWTAAGLQPAKTYEYICNVWNNNGDFNQTGIQTFITLPISGMIAVIGGLI
jgi:hypothetical protein